MKLQTAKSGVEATLVFTRQTKDGRASQVLELTMSVDDKGHYLLRGKARLAAPENRRVEFLNFYPAWMGNSWADRKNFQSTVQEVTPGTFKRRRHSHLSVMEVDIWTSHHKPLMAADSCRAYSFAPSHQFKPLCEGGILFCHGESVTPAVRLISASAPVTTDVCDMWYDEHFQISHGILQKDGSYVYEAEYEIFRLDPLLADQAAAGASELEYGIAAQHAFPSFYCGDVNRFAEPAQCYYTGTCGVFYAFEDPRQIVSWDRKGGPNGDGAIVLNTTASLKPTGAQAYQSLYQEGNTLRAFPLGFAIHLFQGEAVEFSALIQTRGDAAGFVEMREGPYGHTWGPGSHGTRLDVPARHEDWKYVRGSLTSSLPNGNSMIYLGAEGGGQVLFSGLRISRLQP